MKFKLSYFLIILFLFNCSFDNQTGVWKEHNKKIIDKAKKDEKSNKIFKQNEIFDEEIESQSLSIISQSKQNLNWIQENFKNSNNIDHLYYKNNKNRVFKSKKIGKKHSSKDKINLEPLVFNDDIFFYDLKGNIYRYSPQSRKLLWKFNFYKKKFRNIPIKINYKIILNNLIISDNLGYFYNIDIDTGKLVWAKNQGVPLTSEIKSFSEKIFLLNQDNKFYIFEKTNGKKVLDFETFPVILKKNNKQTLSLDSNNNLFFVTSAGQVFALNHENYKINWLNNIKDTVSSGEFGLFNSSPIIVDDNFVYLSSSKSTICLDSLTGLKKWDLPFGTKIRPIVSGNSIFLISRNGFLLNVDKKNGQIIWSKKLFKTKDINLKKMGDVTSLLLLSEQLFFSTQNGYFFFVDYKNGKIINYAKVAKEFYSKPVTANSKIYIIDKEMRVLIFD